MRRTVATTVAVAALSAAVPAQAQAAKNQPQRVREFRLPAAKLEVLRERWHDRLVARYGTKTWAPMRMELTNADLRTMGLPSKRTLLAQRYRKPTTFTKRGRPRQAEPGVLSFAGAGYFGIRPGAMLLFIGGNSIGWCSAAHVYGAPGSYEISTAGHCGKRGEVVTVIGVVGNNTPVLIDIGKIRTSRDGGLGQDWALIGIDAPWQSLVTPTMAFWGGPRGMFTAAGSATDGNPMLAQQIAHYGHGAGIGAGGTPRTGTAVDWAPTHFIFFGAITPGDSGSGSNTVGGDTVGATMEAAGINTHIWIDSQMRDGLGIMAGTRATEVAGTLANGQLVAYPVPAPILP